MKIWKDYEKYYCVTDEDRKTFSDMNGECGKKNPLEVDDYGTQIILRGKVCEHDFCPAGSECHQGYYTAYCCK
ncbi:hypothetical protein OESDEN_20559 [Oesophagostomum dentatum]|uniref:Uncharacterized protein n=1 Tax=Oesophagostomum dentatum TaxID=61180 RepID=A0A0B1S4C0_OESDE|nr:hypothetical protein OESDEN_20559 [Oesophagostomum dentatum]